MKCLLSIFIINVLSIGILFSQINFKLVGHHKIKINGNIEFYKAKKIDNKIFILVESEPNKFDSSNVYLYKKNKNKITKVSTFKYHHKFSINDFTVYANQLYILNDDGLYKVINNGKLINIKKDINKANDNVLIFNKRFVFYGIYDYLGKDSINKCLFISFSETDTSNVNFMRFNLPGIEFSRLVERWVDYNDSIIVLCSPVTDTIFIIDTNSFEKIPLNSEINYTSASSITEMRKYYGYETKRFIMNILKNDSVIRNEKIFITNNLILLSVIYPKFGKKYREIYVFKHNSENKWLYINKAKIKCELDLNDLITYNTFPINFTYSESQFFDKNILYTLSFAYLPKRAPKLYYKHKLDEKKARLENKISLKLLQYEFNY